MPNHLCDAVEGQAVLAQGVLRDLDGNLERPGANHLREGDIGQRHDLLPQAVGQFLHHRLFKLAGELNVDHRLAESRLRDDRALGIRRERRDPVDGEFDLVHLRGDVGAAVEVDIDGTCTFTREGTVLDHALDGLDGFLDAQDDPLLDLFRSRAAERHLDLDLVADELGERLLLDLTDEGVNAESDDADHQQVGGNVVLGEPADQAVDLISPGGRCAHVTHC